MIPIQTDRLLLRPLRESDFDRVKRVWGDAETMSFYPEAFSDEKIRAGIEKHMNLFEEKGYGLMAVVLKESESLVGDCGITIQDIDGEKEFEIGYRIGRAYWGRGLAVEAAMAVKEYGFKTLNLKKLCSYMESAHHQSRRVAEKIGMRLVKEYVNPNNRDRLTAVYSITNENSTK